MRERNREVQKSKIGNVTNREEFEVKNQEVNNRQMKFDS